MSSSRTPGQHQVPRRFDLDHPRVKLLLFRTILSSFKSYKYSFIILHYSSLHTFVAEFSCLDLGVIAEQGGVLQGHVASQ